MGTVKNHIHKILEKLHLQNRAQIAAYARMRRMIGWNLAADPAEIVPSSKAVPSRIAARADTPVSLLLTDGLGRIRHRADSPSVYPCHIPKR